MFLARVRPENRKDFQETFFPDGQGGELQLLPLVQGESIRPSGAWPDLDAWFREWLGGLELALMLVLLLVAFVVLDSQRLPWFAPWAAAGLAGLTVVNLMVPFASAIEWHRYAPVYVSAAAGLAAAGIVGTAWVRGRRTPR